MIEIKKTASNIFNKKVILKNVTAAIIGDPLNLTILLEAQPNNYIAPFQITCLYKSYSDNFLYHIYIADSISPSNYLTLLYPGIAGDQIGFVNRIYNYNTVFNECSSLGGFIFLYTDAPTISNEINIDLEINIFYTIN